jgi:hypothetical protein
MKQYNWTDVHSSNIERVAYDEQQRELLVRFNKGIEYFYVNVPRDLYEGMLNAPSKGKYLNDKIKGSYGYGRNN